MTTSTPKPASGFADHFRDAPTAREPKILPAGGQVWTFPDRVSGRTGELLLKMSQHTRLAAKAGRDVDGDTLAADVGATDEEVLQLTDDVMGPGREQEMLAAGIPPLIVNHVFGTLVTWHLAGKDAAIKAWDSPPGEAVRPTTTKAAASRSRRAKSTPSQGSPSGTTSRKATTRRR